MIEAGTCIHIGDPCTDSYRDCDAGLICDNDKDNVNGHERFEMHMDAVKLEPENQVTIQNSFSEENTLDRQRV